MWAASWQNQQSGICAQRTQISLPSLIRVFAVRMKKAWFFSYPLSASEDSDQTGRMPRLIWVFTGRTVALLVLSCHALFSSCSAAVKPSTVRCDCPSRPACEWGSKTPIIWAASWQNQQNGMCAQRRLRSAWASAQSDQSFRCPHEESLGP